MAIEDRVVQKKITKKATFEEAFKFLPEKNRYFFVEFGTATGLDGSTFTFMEFLMTNCGKLHSIDIDVEEIDKSCANAEKIYGRAWPYFVEYMYPDSFTVAIDYDFVKLDANDPDVNMECFKLVEDNLNEGCVVIIDDVFGKNGLKGKTIIPYLDEHPDWKFLFAYDEQEGISYNGMIAFQKVK